MIPARPDSGVDIRQGRDLDQTMEERKEMQIKKINDTEGGGVNEKLVMMTPSSFIYPTKEPPASLSPVETMSLVEARQKKASPSCSVNPLGGVGSMSRCE